MAIPLNVNGTPYSYPQQGDVGYAAQATAWAQAITNGVLQLGGAYTLLADLNLSAFGVLAPYFTSKTANPAQSGVLRLAKTDAVKFRNNANGADVAGLALNSNDNLTANGVQLDGQPLVIAQSTAGQSIPNGANTTINFATETTDTDNAWSTNTFVVPAGKGGDYDVYAAVEFAAGLTAGVTTFASAVWVNGVEACLLENLTFTPATTGTLSLVGSTTLTLTAGQALTIVVFQNNSGARSLTTTGARNRVVIRRLV